ncbi:MAG TPA: hypothetical protein VFD32_00105 [Dehalococcoidia bacterium]|nr:hypothetical protein [Dehalococcoidia bacterium]
MSIGAGCRAQRGVLVLIVMCACGLAGARSPGARAAPAAGAVHTLTLADNGTTVAVALGDRIELRLDVNLNWTVSVSDSTVLRRPPGIALVREVQGLWEAIARGNATISATGDAPCRLATPPCSVPSLLFSATVNVVGTPPPPPSGGTATYQAGWNIVGVPDGTTLPVDAWSWEPLRGQYVRIGSGTPLSGGRGYWAYFTAPQSVPLAAGGATAVQIPAPAGSWVLIGDPSALSGATIAGADAIYSYDPLAGTYTPAKTLGPGGGAWALSMGGGAIVVNAQPPSPPASRGSNTTSELAATIGSNGRSAW